MTRLHGASHGECAERAPYRHHPRLPPGAPEVIGKHTINVSDPARVFSWARDERQRTFNHLVKRYKAQLLYGCLEPNCMAPTCLNFRRRSTKAPLRKFTDLSARTVACYLASQDDAEAGLCRHPSAANLNSSNLDAGRKTHHSGSFTTTEPDRFKSNPQKQSELENRSKRLSDTLPSNTEQGTLESGQSSRKDPKSFTQNLFDTLALRMVEWLPLRRASFHDPRCEDESGLVPATTPKETQKIGVEPHPTRAVSGDTKSFGSRSSSSSIHSSPSSNHGPSTLEVKMVGHPVKRLSLEPLEPWRQSQRPAADERLKSRRKGTKKTSVNSTPTTAANPSQSLPSPPAWRHRPQKHRRTAGGVSKHNAHVSWEDQNGKKSSRVKFGDDSPSGHEVNAFSRLKRQGARPKTEEKDNDDVPAVQSLFCLTNEIVGSLTKIMFETNDDEETWKPEIAQLESRGYTEPWDWQYATHRQRMAFPFIAQSIFYVLSSPKQVLLSFRDDDSKGFPKAPLDVITLEETFRKLHRICPWEITLHSLWLCMEKLFNPPVELSLPKLQRRSSKTLSITQSPSPKSESLENEYIPDCDAAYIAVIVMLALTSAIPQADKPTWEIIRRVRSSGTVMPDSIMKELPKVQCDAIVEASDRLEHDLGLRLSKRLARVVSTRLALHEVSKAKASHTSSLGSNDKCELIEHIISILQQYQKAISSTEVFSEAWSPERKTIAPMVVVEWLRSVFLKEWDGKPELSKASAAGGALQLLGFFYRDRAKLGLLPEDFHTPFFSERLDPLEMPTEWVELIQNNRTMHLLSYSFMFPPATLVTYFRAINHATMSKSFENAVIASKHVTAMAFSGTVSIDDDISLLARMRTALTTFFVITVRREHTLVDALDQLWRRERRELLRPLKVRMGMDDGEEGVDQGGVQQEFFRIVMSEALDPAYGMFTVVENESGMYYFQPCSFEPLYKFELLGLLVSLALYNGVTLPVDFPIALYRKLLGLKVKTTDHIRVGWPELAKGFDIMLAWGDGDVQDVFMRTYEFSFDAFGAPINVDMERTDRNEPWPVSEKHAQWEKSKQRLHDQRNTTKRFNSHDSSDGGNNVSMLREYSLDSRQQSRDSHVIGILKGAPSRLSRRQISTEPQPEASNVTNKNRHQYVKDYIFWLTDKSVRPQYEAFQRGFFTCLDRTALSIFSPEALKTVLEGRKEIDIAELKKHTRYEGGWDATHPLVEGFWRLVMGYSHEQKGRLLEFVTASDRVPVNGISSMMFVIQRNGVGDSRLPTSLTCFGRLLLPEYSSTSVLEQKLDKALENARGFGVA